MTTANGTYKYCNTDKHVSLTLRCAGPHCTGLQSNLTCTQPDPSYWICTNNLTCTGISSIISSFSISQPNINVTQTQSLTINGTSFVLTQDDTGNVTLANGTASSSLSPSVTGATNNPSSTTRSFAPRRAWSWPLLIVASVLVTMVTRVAGDNMPCISEIVNEVNIATSWLKGDLEQVGQDLCEHFYGSGLEAASGPLAEASAIALCYNRLFVGEGVLALAVGAATAEVLLGPEVLTAVIVNSAICLGIVGCFINEVLDQPASTFCTIPPAHPTAAPSSTTTSAATGLATIPKISATSGPAACILCSINGYFQGMKSWVDTFCSPPQTDYYVPAKFLVYMFCDPTVANIEPFTSLCTAACLNPCQQYSVEGVIQVQGTAIEPTLQNFFCGDLCGPSALAANKGNCPIPNSQFDAYCYGLCPGAERGCPLFSCSV